MNKTDLVVIKDNVALQIGSDIFKPHINYRCSVIDAKHIMVNAVVISMAKFKRLFDYTHTVMLSHFKALGLVDAYSVPVSKAKFAKLADIHTYGTGRKALKVYYFRNSRDVIYGFYPSQGTKTENTLETYNWFLQLVEGNMTPIDEHDVMFGNCGIPLSYSELRIA